MHYGLSMRKPSKKTLIKKADDLWSLLVKMKAGYRCEYCGKTSYLNSHHIFSRTKKSVRWNDLNGVCLCAGHHTFSSDFSAHQTPTEFTEWVKEYRGDKWYAELRRQAYTPLMPNLELIQAGLKEKIELWTTDLNT